MISAILILVGVTVVSAAVAFAWHRKIHFLQDKKTGCFPLLGITPTILQIPSIRKTGVTFEGIKRQFLQLKYKGRYRMDLEVEDVSDGRQKFAVDRLEIK